MTNEQRLQLFKFLANHQAIMKAHFPEAEVWRSQSKATGYTLQCKMVGDGNEKEHYQHFIDGSGAYDSPSIPSIFIDSYLIELSKRVYGLICQDLNSLSFLLGISSTSQDTSK